MMANLILSINQKSMPLLRMYSYTSWFFTVFIYSVLAIVTGVGMITSKDGFINYCIDMGNNVDNHCINKVNSQLLWLAIILLFLGSVHVSILIFFDPYLKFIFFIYFFFLFF